MNKAIIALAASLLTAGSALAADQDDIMAVLKQWNDTDEAKSVAACAEDAAVIDDVPPFEWHGPGACFRWQKDYKGKRVAQTATTTFALRGTAAGWRITGWAWATQTVR